MNEREVLIWHFSTTNERWYDATKSIVWYGEDNNAWKVKFSSSSKYRHVSFRNMFVYENPKKIEFVELYYRDSPVYKVKELICFDGRAYKIFRENGNTLVAFPNEIKIVKDVLKNGTRASGVMAYYRRVVQETVESEDDQFLIQQFDDIEYVNEESVLAMYLQGKLASTKKWNKLPVICPFGMNLSQSAALEQAFSNRISIVEGPPGTGKTQTILNFIANAVINGLSVAVVSNNNSATDNVLEKLEKYGYSFMAAPLGNSDNVDSFFEEYDTAIPTFVTKKINEEKLRELYEYLPGCFRAENNKKKLLDLLDGFNLEYEHFKVDNQNIDFSAVKIKPEKVKPESVLKIITKFKEKDKKLSFLSKFFLRLKLKVGKDFFELNPDDYVLYLNNLYYLSRINDIKKQIREIDKELHNKSLSESLEKYKNLSKQYFENQLNRVFINSTRYAYERSNYKRQFNEFVKDYPVVLSSTYSLAKCSKRGFLFDYLIVDESSQVNMASAILSMRMARNIIVVGDIKQLPQIDDNEFKDRNEELLKQFSIPRQYSYYGNSIMSSLLSLYGKKIPKVMLREHYRCNPDIIGFCNQRFYDNKLVIYTNKKDSDYSMKVLKTAPGNFARKNPEGTGQYNQREIDEIRELLNKEQLEDVGVIAPYRYHTELIQEQLGDKVDASTVHKFQGREKKTIIFSSVVNSKNDFVEDDNLINVAVSRAVDKFIFVTSDKIAKSNSGVLSDLVNYIKYHNEFGKEEEGNVKSIYDLLYSDYEEALNDFRLLHPSKQFDTENLTKELLKNILKEQKYKSFYFSMHVSLKDFIRSGVIGLTDEEYKFYRNPCAHADFLIYNKMSRKPVLVIEVDGVSFHEQRKEQKERDAKKNSILEKSGISLLRLKTNESGEEDRIKQKLNELI